jgi:hypothetical protein
MSDPKRLSSGSDSEVERLLLRAGRAGAPARSKELAFLAASSALPTAGAAAGGAVAGKGVATGIAKAAGSFAALKWVGVLGIAGAGALAGVVASESRHAPTVLTVPVAARSSSFVPGRQAGLRPNGSRSDPSTGWTPVPVDPSTIPTTSTERPIVAPSALPAARSASDLRAELASLEEARNALAAREPVRALSVLERHAAQFPEGTMAPEETMLRIEALVMVGDSQAAKRLAEAFLASHPDAPYAARVRSLLGTANP